MHCTVFISGLLPLPPGLHPRATALETLLARGNTRTGEALDRAAWLCRTFGVPARNDWPVAPLLLRADGVDPENHFWLRADPVHLQPGLNRLVLAAAIDDLGNEEAAALVNALNRHFAPDGVIFGIAPSGRWYLRTAGAPDIATTPLAQVVGHDIDPHLPRGRDALTWHRIINEAQMVLHAQPVNAAREARGLPAINSIWPWGGGTLPVPTASPYAAVLSDDPLTRALAGNIHRELPADLGAWLAESPAATALLVFSALERAGSDLNAWQAAVMQTDRDGLAPLLAALYRKQITGLRLVTPGSDHSIESEALPAHRWRWWRRQRRLADLLA
ncbi:MAG TPA: hypothetical protein VMT94_01670 [Burkholderiales bacterium]|nr:hypothetical protein [Burkholderiales bacterium]